ncbi:MAG: ABC transporter substrate-binding protein [Chloroflexi bacterium]|nr:ABC transporter substrate-binding protein [Chloroflexota bacterium]
MKKIRWLIGLIECLFLVACGGNLLAPLPTKEIQVAGCIVPVGLVTSLTGGAAGNGIEQSRALEMATDEINAAGGISNCKLQLIVKDDATDPATARALAKTLGEQSSVVAIIGTASTGTALTVAAVTENLRIPFLVPSVSGELVTAIGYRWVFRLAASESMLVGAMFDFIRNLPPALNPRSLAMLYSNTVSNRSTFVAVERETREAGISFVAAELYGFRAKDYRSQLTRVKQGHPDIIFFESSDLDDAIGLMQQSQELDLNPKIYLAITGPFITSAYAKVGEYVIVGSQWTTDVPWRDDKSQNSKTFGNKFSERFSSAAGIRAVSTYTALYVIKAALEQAAAKRTVVWSDVTQVRNTLRTALSEIRLENTLFGPIAFDESGQNAHPVLLTQIIGQDFVIVYPEKFKARAPLLPAPAWQNR